MTLSGGSWQAECDVAPKLHDQPNLHKAHASARSHHLNLRSGPPYDPRGLRLARLMVLPVGAIGTVNQSARGPIGIRWWIFAYMFAFAMLSYIQRNGVAVAAVTIMSDLRFTQWQIGLLNTAFTTAYALTQLPGGIIGQRFGARLTYVGIGIVSLIATLMTPRSG